jgi:hypothetical protein
VRERISRLAIRGGWAAARFGSSTVARYVQNLDSPHVLRVFDAVLALVSIAAVADAERAAIAHALERRLANRIEAAVGDHERTAFPALARSAARALATLADRSDARIATLVRALDSDRDAAEIDDDGYFPAILAMPAVAVAPARALFPQAASDAPHWRPARALEALTRTLAARPTQWN